MKSVMLIVGFFGVLAAPALAQEAPPAQAELNGFVEKFASAYDEAQNDMARGLVRHQRAEAICGPASLLRKTRGKVEGWFGIVKTLDAVKDGRGVFAVMAGPKITVMTTNNPFSEQVASIKTLIPVGSPLYQAVIKLKVGQQVRFSGVFLPSRDDCLEEASLTRDGAMHDPDFLFRFDSVQPSE